MEVTQVLPRDAIPSVDDPAFGPEYFGDPDDEVVVVEGEQARAYPIRILHYHEIVNDCVDGDPLAVTWCPLCGSAVVYEARVGGRELTFGVSGKLADDDLVMYDHQTESEWKQSTGECIAGQFEGAQLTVRPAGIVPFRRFREEYPDGVVLQRPDKPSEAASDTDEPAPVSYDEHPYAGYFDGDGFGLAAHRGEGDERTWDRTDLDPKAVVLGVETGGEAVGYPQPRIEAADGVVTDTVGGTALVVCATADGLHAFENPGYAFELDGETLRADGTTWDPVTGESADGRRLDRIPARRLFAFTWQDDHGPDAFFER
jgi:hypothetical protein